MFNKLKKMLTKKDKQKDDKKKLKLNPDGLLKTVVQRQNKMKKFDNVLSK